jgi:hypothetical protein
MQRRGSGPSPPSTLGDAIGDAISGFGQVSGVASTQSFITAFKAMELFSKTQMQSRNLQISLCFHDRCDLILGFLTWQWIYGPCQDMCVDALRSPEDIKQPWLWKLVKTIQSLVDRVGDGGDWESESSFDCADYFGGPPSINVASLAKPPLQNTLLRQNAQVVELTQDVLRQWLPAVGNQSQGTKKVLGPQALGSWITRSMVTGAILAYIPNGATLLLVESVQFANINVKARVFPRILATGRHGVPQTLWMKFLQDLRQSSICVIDSEEQAALQELKVASASVAVALGIPDSGQNISGLPHAQSSLLHTLPRDRLDTQLMSHGLHVERQTAQGFASGSGSALFPPPAPTTVQNSIQRAAWKVISFLEVVQPLLEDSSTVQRPHVGHVSEVDQQRALTRIKKNPDKYSPFREVAPTRDFINRSKSNPFHIECIKTERGFFSVLVTRVIFGNPDLYKDSHGLLYSSKQDWQMVRDRWGTMWRDCGAAYGTYSHQIVDDKAPATWWEVAAKWQKRWLELDQRGQDMMPWKEAVKLVGGAHGFGRLLTLLLAGDLSYAGVVAWPSARDVGSELGPGSTKALEKLKVDARSTKPVQFEALYKAVNGLITGQQRELWGFNELVLEHTLCKMVRSDKTPTIGDWPF